jgi:hypothetical protein
MAILCQKYQNSESEFSGAYLDGLLVYWSYSPGMISRSCSRGDTV